MTVAGALGAVEGGAPVIIYHPSTGETVLETANEDGSFAAQISALPADRLTIHIRNAATNTSGPITETASGNDSVPRDPLVIAPPVNTTEISDMGALTKFICFGNDRLQAGVDPASIPPN